jgi:4-amino-4-deoxy-L-arabinose transferase-like glycosyltransferase
MRPFLQRLAPILHRLDTHATGGLDALAVAWRGPLLAALIAIVAGSFSLFTLPPLDRDESRFAQATAQMLEGGDLVMIQYQDQPRFKKPVGIHWLQAAAVSTLSSAGAREIWAYRLPSLLGAAIAAAALAWGVAGFYGPRAGLFAGAILAASGLLSTEASIAKTDAVLCGAVTLAMAAMARLYAAARGGPATGFWTRLAFWAGLAVGLLDKGPIAPAVVLMAGLALWAWDRDGAWLGRRRLNWGWGLLLVGLVFLPWAAAITVATDGAFWSTAVGGDLAPKLRGGQEGHGAPFGYYTVLAPFLIFPGSLLLPGAAVLAWKRRHEAGVRFALAWLIPTWLMFELLPTKLVHYTLPAYGALAWLMAAAVAGPDAPPIGRIARIVGAAFSGLAALLFAAIAIVGLKQYGDRSDAFAAILTAVLYLAAGGAGAVLLLRKRGFRALIAALALGVLAHGMLAGVLLPRLEPLWLSKRAADLVRQAALDPRTGLAQGPIEVAGYAEPSLVFALGTKTGLDDAGEAAEGVAQGRPAIVEKREDAAFQAALAARHATARSVGSVSGVDYSNGDAMTLTVYAPTVPGRRMASPGARAGSTAAVAPRP